jgi:acyl-coenzyme A thioesterase PaaI-like protein
MTVVPAVVEDGDESKRGLRFRIEPPGLVADLRLNEAHEGIPGFLHGGMAATVLDEAMANLGYKLDGDRYVTGTLELRYLRPVPLVTGTVRVEAWRKAARSRPVSRVWGQIVLPDGQPAVTATGLFIRMRDDRWIRS